MSNLKGVYKTTKKNGSIYYRASITIKNKHISLGSFDNEALAHEAYQVAYYIIFTNKYNYEHFPNNCALNFEKWIVLHNFKDNGYYIKNPIYMHKYYFSYFISQNQELLFDVEDLFYYSNHKIFKRNGYYFVNDYGIQINILSRYGVKNFAVEGKDFHFKDDNSNNLRYHNIVVINQYTGVEKKSLSGKNLYVAKIHINGNYIIGKYSSETKAAIAYNKVADFVNNNHISDRSFARNYITELSERDYTSIYNSIKIPIKISLLQYGTKPLN